MPATWTALVALSLVFVGAITVAVSAQAQRRQITEHELTTLVKAGVVFNLTKYVRWPEEVFDDDENERAPIVITLVGEDRHGFEPYLERVARGQRSQERRIIIRRIDFPEPDLTEDEIDEEAWDWFVRQLHDSQIVFIGRASEARVHSGRVRYEMILEAIEGRPVLTVSDIFRFAEDGGMIGLVIRQNRWALDANLASVRRNELRLDSRLLELTRIVEEPTDRE